MVTKPKRPKGLGRGLDALLGADSGALIHLDQEATISSLMQLPVSALQAGKYQPRTIMDEESIKSLALSIQQQGLMQPIIVRKLPGKDEGYEVIAGERRLRAAKLAQLDNVPVIIKDVDDENAAIMSLIENIQREDLNPLEEAKGLKRLLDEFALTHEQISDVIGRSRSATSNLLRLLNLAMPVQDMLLSNKIDMGHARALLALTAADQVQIAQNIIAKSLSVRETERLVNQGLTNKTQKSKNNFAHSADVGRMQNALADKLGTTVNLRANNKGKGKLTLEFHDWEQFQGLLEKLKLQDLLEQSNQ
jgi:ParB family chromosome partitioning protein